MKHKIFLVFVLVAFGVSVLFVGQIFSQTKKILARIGDRVITQKEMTDLMAKYIQYKPAQGDALTMDEKKKLLDRMVAGSLLALTAEKEKLDETPEFKEKLALYKNELLIQEYVEKKIAGKVTVTDQELEQKLRENPNLIPRESLVLREIVVKTEKEAQEIYEKLNRGEDFAGLAVQKSIGPTADSGGHLKMPVSRGMLPKELETVAFSLKKDEFSKPIKTDKGYTILSLVEKKVRTPEEIKKIEDTVKEKMRNIEKGKKVEAEVTMRIEELKKTYKVEVYYDAIQ